MSESDIKKQILDYMLTECRPFKATDIFNNLHPDGGKSAFTRALDLLVSENKMIEKTYKNQKVYSINQDMYKFSDIKDIKSMENELAELTNIYNKLIKEVKNLEIKLVDLEKNPTTDKAEEELKAVKAKIPLLEDKLKLLQSKSSSIEPGEKEALFEKKEKAVKNFQSRKRLASNIIDAIMEGYPKNKKHLLEEIGIEETDDDLKLQT